MAITLTEDGLRVACQLRQMLDALYDGYNDDDWVDGLNIAESQGIVVVTIFHPEEAAAMYSPTTRGCIIINLWHNGLTIARAIRHELGHHLLWVGSSLDYELYHGLWGKSQPLHIGADAADWRHAICEYAVRS